MSRLPIPPGRAARLKNALAPAAPPGNPEDCPGDGALAAREDREREQEASASVRVGHPKARESYDACLVEMGKPRWRLDPPMFHPAPGPGDRGAKYFVLKKGYYFDS